MGCLLNHLSIGQIECEAEEPGTWKVCGSFELPAFGSSDLRVIYNDPSVKNVRLLFP
jgi:hypothetical protein